MRILHCGKERWLETGVLDEGLKYWRRQLEGMPELLELPTDRPRRRMQTFRGDVFETALSEDQTASLKQLTQDNQATLYMTLLAGFAVLLSHYSGQDDIVVGSPIANRQELQLEEMIGFFVNTIVMRVRVKPAMTFRELLAQARRTALEAYQHQDIPFERLVEEMSPERSLNTTPVFQVMFALQNAPWLPETLEGLHTTRVKAAEARVRTDLELYAWEEERRIGLMWVYNVDLFDRWRVEQMARRYVRVMTHLAGNVDEPIGRMNILEEQEERQILENSNAADPAIPPATQLVMLGGNN